MGITIVTLVNYTLDYETPVKNSPCSKVLYAPTY